MTVNNKKQQLQQVQQPVQQPVAAQPAQTVQAAQPAAQTTTVQTSSGGRRGVTAQTQQNLDRYAQGYQPSATVQQAQAYLNQMQQNRPGAYQSQYQPQLDDLLQQINGRGPFQYDLNADMLYRQYRDQYQRMGQQAMMDTMGQAAGLTGGYGSSYSQNAGQQAYQGYLQQLNDRIPELYDRALNKWQAEGDDLYRRYGLLNDAENTAYGRYRDTVSDWRADLADARDAYNSERSFDYGQWGDMLNYWSSQADRENSDWWQQTEFDYQKERDAVADSQWEREFQAAQAARAAAARAAAAQQTDWQAMYQQLLDQLHGNPNYQSVPGTNQGRVEIAGYGTADYPTYLKMLAQGLVSKETNGKTSLKKKPTTGNRNLIM